MTSVEQLPQFVLTSPTDSDLCHGLDLDGSHALRLTTQSESDGLFTPATDNPYIYIAMAVWLDSSGSGAAMLYEAGQTAGIALGYHTNSLGDGDHAILFGVSHRRTTPAPANPNYATRFVVPDLRSSSSDKELHSIELLYELGIGVTLYVDGVAVAMTSDAGDDYGVDGFLETNAAIGGVDNKSAMYQALAPNHPTIVGSTSVWGSANQTDYLTGNILYFRTDLSAGIAAAEFPLVSTVVDTVASLTGTIQPAQTLSFTKLINWVATDSNDAPILAPVSVAANLDVITTNEVRLRNYASTSFDLVNLEIAFTGVGSSVTWAESDDTPIADITTYTIPAGDYVKASVTLDTSTSGASQAGTVRFFDDTAVFESLITYSLTVTSPSTGGGASRIFLLMT